MEQFLATGYIPYEIGDTIILKNSIFQLEIQDIRMIQYIKVRKVEFEVQLNGVWYSTELIDRRIIAPKEEALKKEIDMVVASQTIEPTLLKDLSTPKEGETSFKEENGGFTYKISKDDYR